MKIMSNKTLVFVIIGLFIVAGFVPSISSYNEINTITKNICAKADGTSSKTKNNNGSLSGYVTDTSMNPIEDARIRVYFHEKYKENYTDASGYYNVTNIPICYCMKNATASKNGYSTEWIFLSIVENTTHDFILSPLFDVYVDDNAYQSWYDVTHVRTIQEGIDNATTGDTVFVYNGKYYENVVVDKTINLIGEDSNNTVIDGGGVDDAVSIMDDNTMISNFMIHNDGSNGYGIFLQSNFNNISNNIIHNNSNGIHIDFECHDNILFCNKIEYNVNCGIRYSPLTYSNHIINNSIQDNDYGIRCGDSHDNHIKKNSIISNNNGIHFYSYCTGNSIFENNIFFNNDYGIDISYGENNRIFDNRINSNGEHGLTLYQCFSNQIFNNIFLNNSCGLSLLSGTWTNIDNAIYHNNFYDNIINAIDECDNNDNQWYNLSLEEGNYWHDYNGTDQKGDGIGETPYNISGGDNQDLYPFITMYGWLIDVNQIISDRGFPIRHALDGDWAGAQNFTPTIDTLTKAEIYLRRFGTPEFNLTVELRTDNPQGTLLDTLNFIPAEVPSSWTWLELEFTDTTITPGVDYFIVCSPAPSGVTTSFGYEWGYAFGDQYPDGAFWFTRNGGGLWLDLPTMYEFCFRTYRYS